MDGVKDKRSEEKRKLLCQLVLSQSFYKIRAPQYLAGFEMTVKTGEIIDPSTSYFITYC